MRVCIAHLLRPTVISRMSHPHKDCHDVDGSLVPYNGDQCVAQLPTRRHRRAAIAIVWCGAILAALAAFASSGPRRALALGQIKSALGIRSASTAMAPGDTVVIYGPHVFSTPTGSSTISVETFTATPTAGRRYSVIMQRGSGSLTTATVLFNGLQIASATDFATTTPVSKVVNLLTSDTIKVTLAGAAGATLNVQVISDPDPNYAIYGTRRFVKQGGGTTSEQFTRPATATAPFYLSVINGPGGTTRATSGSIKLDNVDQATPSDFSNNVAGFVKPITLSAGTHTISVGLQGTNGATIDVRITATDTTHPVIALTAPAANAIVGATTVSVSGSVTDQTPTTVTVNGAAASMTGSSFSATATLATEGNNTITVRARDGAGLTTDSVRTVIRDTQAPSLTVSSPADGSYTNQSQVTLAGTVSDITAVTVNVNGTPVTVTAGAFSTQVTLANGLNVLTTTATDAASHATSVVRQVTRDTQAPTLTVSAPEDQSTTTESSVVVSGHVTDGCPVTVTANGTALTVAANGDFSGSVAVSMGSNTISIVATDAAGNTSNASHSVTRAAPPDVGGPLPIDNTIGAPALDPTRSANVLTATSFLYSGASPIQTGVAAGTIKLEQAAVVRGRVLTRAGLPISGVTVSIAGHPEFGSTMTRANGLYDMAVNGGGAVRVQFSKSGLLPVERQVNVPWQQYAVVEDVMMISLDPIATVVDFSDSVEVAQGSVQSDARGTRRTTAIFEQGTTATLVLPNGTTQPAPSLTVRATEFTVGPNGPTAMPAVLPPTSAYTYATELSADEAISAGAKEIRFSKPVAVYVDNFIGFKVGTSVPLGYFDRSKGQWLPEPDGRVIKIVGVTNGRADIAVDSTLAAANAATLAARGFTDAERGRLATLYSIGATLWRVEVGHFTIFDLNWFLRWFHDYVNPKPGPFDPNPNKCVQEMPFNSVIGCESQTLGEALSLPGTGVDLSYKSEFNIGSKARTQLELRLIDDSIPPSLDEIVVKAAVAGRNLVWRYPRASITQRLTLKADLASLVQRTDPYGRPLAPGGYPVDGTLTYIYRGSYGGAPPASIAPTFSRASAVALLGSVCDSTLPGCNPRLDVSAPFHTTVHLWDARSTDGLGGWTLSAHHTYDPVGRVLYMGDGTRRSVGEVGSVVRTVAGNGVEGSGGDGGPGNQASILPATALAFGRDGTVFFAQQSCCFAVDNRIRKISPNGVISTLTATAGGADITAGPDGTLYVHGGGVVASVDPATGAVELLAGGGTNFTGEGIRAKGEPGIPSDSVARFFNISGLAAGPDGSVYVASYQTLLVRRIMPDGRVYTAAGNGQGCGFDPCGGDGLPATQVKLRSPEAIAVGPDGSLYILDNQYPGRYLRKVGLDGIMSTVIGPSANCPNDNALCGDGGPVASAGISSNTNSVSVAPDGSILLTNFTRVRRIGPDGIITTVVGAAPNTYAGDGKPALQFQFTRPAFAAVGPDGRIYVSDELSFRIFRVEQPLPGLATTPTNIASADGSEVYVFDGTGRHLETLDALTKATLIQFAYDAQGRLVSATDVNGNVTQIERDGTGKPTAVVGPFGKRNTVTLDANGYLETVTNPAGELTRVQHDSVGLLVRFIDPKNNPPRQFVYDSIGRLTSDQNSIGGSWSSTRQQTDSSFTVGWSTALGRTQTHFTQPKPDGSELRRITDAAGLVTQSVFTPNRVTTTTSPDGVVSTVVEGADPRFGLQASIPAQMSVRMPSNLQLNATSSRRVTLTDPTNPLSLTTQVDSLVINGRAFTSVFDAATRTLTGRSATGRQVVSLVDTLGRVAEVRRPGEATTQYMYGARGFLTSIAQAGRAFSYNYDSAGRVTKVTDPLGRVEQYAYDSVGRVVKQTLFNGREILYGYDANGNLSSLMPPARPAHTFTANAADLDSIYAPPAAGLPVSATRYTYNLDRQLTRILRPDSLAIDVAYDTAGRPSTVTMPSGQITYTYSPTNGHLTSLTAPGGLTLGYTYDGVLPKTVTWGGAVQGSVGYTYDNNFRVTSLTVNGANGVSLGYDNDGLLTSAGALTLTRDPANGRLNGTTLSSITTSISYDDSTGVVTSYTAKSGSDTLLRVSYTRDSLDRITQLSETIQGTTRAYAYAYDLVGRLDQVRLNGVLVSDYEFDANGNRTGFTTQAGTVGATFDDQDRILTNGNSTYAYSANGELKSKVTGSDTTRFTYDVAGNLVQVRFPDGSLIEYLADALGRRVGKKVNGVLTQGFLYERQLAPIAELDGSNQVVARYVYGPRVNVPEYMVKTGITYRFITDHLGSVRLVVNTTTGQVAQRIDYDEFGRVLTNTNPSLQPFGFAGGLYDAATGLVHFGARDYDAETGRWTAKDPLGFGGGSSNLFAYVLEDPVNFVDLTGLQAVESVIGGTLGGAGVFPWRSLTPDVQDWVDRTGRDASRWVDIQLEQMVRQVQRACAATAAEIIWLGTRAGDLPARGKPNSSAAKDNGDGTGQIRDYGPDGRAKTDYDFGHDHTGAGDPHAHDWDWTKAKPRQSPRPIGPGETPPRPPGRPMLPRPTTGDD